MLKIPHDLTEEHREKSILHWLSTFLPSGKKASIVIEVAFQADGEEKTSVSYSALNTTILTCQAKCTTGTVEAGLLTG